MQQPNGSATLLLSTYTGSSPVYLEPNGEVLAFEDRDTAASAVFFITQVASGTTFTLETRTGPARVLWAANKLVYVTVADPVASSGGVLTLITW